MASTSRYQSYGMHEIKTGIMFFWGLWFLFAVLTNSFDMLGTHNALPADWRFRSGNLALIISVVNIYRLSTTFANLIFFAGLMIETAITVLFFIAATKFWAKRRAWKWVNTAFGVSIAFWASFVLFDELFIAYNFEGTHITLLISEIIVLIAIHLLPSTER